MKIRELLQSIRKDEAKLLIVGLGISGIESIKFCLRNNLKFVAVERQSREELYRKSKFQAELEQIFREDNEIYFEIDGEKLKQKLQNVRLAVLSPGVPVDSAVCSVLNREGVPFISELELGIELQALPSIVVTGSNGKSTTVSLIHEMLKKAGWDSVLCGNVGIPVIASCDLGENKSVQDANKVLVVEASSYQIETCNILKPKVALLLNISENHLERHGDINRYLRIKSKIFERQDRNDLAIINADHAKIAGLYPGIRARVSAIGVSKKDQKYHTYSRIDYRPSASVDKIDFEGESYDISSSKLRGIHNRYNISAAICAVREMGVAAEIIQAAINDFQPLEHRLEMVGKIKQIDCINDSKSTTVASSAAALSTVLAERGQAKITVMLGGLSKAGSWDPLCKLLKENLSALNKVVCFGKDAGLIGNYCKTFQVPFIVCANLESAVREAFRLTNPQDILLFTPGCASFDEFKDFEARGRAFKQLCNLK